MVTRSYFEKHMIILLTLLLILTFAGAIYWFDSLFEETCAVNIDSLDVVFPFKSVLVVLAHPDDEIFVAGMLARVKQKTDLHIRLLCATGGEGGLRGKNISNSELLRIRRSELSTHCRLLGIDDLEILNYDDGKVTDAYSSLLRDVVRDIRRYKPDMLLTFDPECGFTLHPDHMAVGQVVSEAFSLAADPCHDDVPDEPHQVRWLIYSVVPKKIMKYFGGRRGEIISEKQQSAQYAIRIDRNVKIRGWHSHGSQSAYLQKIWKIPYWLLYVFFDKEHYIATEVNMNHINHSKTLDVS